MAKSDKSVSLQHQAVVALVATVLFAIVSSPFTYKLTGSLTEQVGLTTSVDGVPNASGVALHSVVFFVLLFVIWFGIPSMKKDSDKDKDDDDDDK